MSDWQDTRERLAGAGARMVAVLDEPGLTGLVATIAGLTPAGAAAILAETGDPARFASPRSLVKHAGLCPRDNASGAFGGKTPISGRGRPRLRVAAWRGLGRAAGQPRAGRQVHLPDHPRGEPAGPPAGPDRLRRRPAALDPRCHHPPGELGPRHRRRENTAAAGRMNPAPAH
jgi:Transposase IS116/IS110/IS902 family